MYDDKFDITFNFKDGTQTIFFSEIKATKNSDIKSLGAPRLARSNRRSGFLVPFYGIKICTSQLRAKTHIYILY